MLVAVQHEIGLLYKALQTVKDFSKDANAHNNLAHTLLALRGTAQTLVRSCKVLAINAKHLALRQNEAGASWLAGVEGG